SNYKVTQQDTTVDSSVSGNTPVGIVTGSSPGATTTTVLNSPFNANGNATQHHGEITEEHNDPYNMLNNNVYNNMGLPISTLQDITGTPTEAAEYKIKTCKGTRDQYFNNPALNGNPMGVVLAALGGIIGAINKTADFIRVVLDEMNIFLRLIESFTPA